MINSNQLHVILGASGAIGMEIIKDLQSKNLPFRAVERSKTIPHIETVHADITKIDELKKALIGATHVYCCVGVKYDTKKWQQVWPTIIDNLIEACSEVDATLVMFDNIYMYGPSPLENPITELHPRNPISNKGKVRLELEEKLLSAFESGNLKGLIARAADFYGPGATLSMLYNSVLDRMLVGKTPQWLANPDLLHTYTYTPDAARGCVTLALDESSYRQVWHLPTSKEILTSKQIIAIFQKKLGMSEQVQVMPRLMYNILALFIPILKELKEMLYQFDNPYVFDSSKFEAKYPNFKITSYQEGVNAMVDFYQKTKFLIANIFPKTRITHMVNVF
jgi:nucleoside-diphosphate-sugar epimerase